MTDADLEILIYAGIAAGLKFVRPSDDKTALLMEGVEKPWNPIADDGDALRLAGHLDMHITPGAPCRIAYARADRAVPRIFQMVAWGPDKQAAIRRAITLAAAQIGKQMGGGNV